MDWTSSSLPVLRPIAFAFIFMPGLVLADDEWPVLKGGLWQFTQTDETKSTFEKGKKVVTSKKVCVGDPLEEWKKRKRLLSAIGCKVSSSSREGNSYSYFAGCLNQGDSMSSLVVSSETSYSTHVHWHTGGSDTDLSLLGQRIGDCS
jgi:hypothetical protein